MNYNLLGFGSNEKIIEVIEEHQNPVIRFNDRTYRLCPHLYPDYIQYDGKEIHNPSDSDLVFLLKHGEQWAFVDEDTPNIIYLNRETGVIRMHVVPKDSISHRDYIRLIKKGWLVYPDKVEISADLEEKLGIKSKTPTQVN